MRKQLPCGRDACALSVREIPQLDEKSLLCLVDPEFMGSMRIQHGAGLAAMAAGELVRRLIHQVAPSSAYIRDSYRRPQDAGVAE